MTRDAQRARRVEPGQLAGAELRCLHGDPPLGHYHLHAALAGVRAHPESCAHVAHSRVVEVNRERLRLVVDDVEVCFTVQVDVPRRGAEVGGHEELGIDAQHDVCAVGEAHVGALPPRRGILAHGRGACFDADDGEGSAGDEDKHRGRGEADC